jgi:hypothetical protein
MRQGVRSCLLIASAAACLFVAPSAQAATVNLGQTGLSTCGGAGYSETQIATAGPPAYSASTDGLLTSWSVAANSDTGATVKLRVFRPTGTPNEYLVVADSPQQGPLAPNVVNGPFPVSIPVKAGDLLGLNVVAATAPSCDMSTSDPGDVMLQFSPDTAVVGDRESSTDTFTAFRANIAATFTPQPGVSSLSPSSGPRTGGTQVTIGGHDLAGATAVSFGGRAAAAFTVNSDTQITAASPAGTVGPVDVRVTTPAGQSPAAAGDRFTFLEVCTVPSLKGKRVKKAKRRLRGAECRIGNVKGHKGGRVKKQNPTPGAVLPADGTVNVKLK